jgi:hypothetical protein
MSICAELILVAPAGSVYANTNVCVAPLPEFGVTDTDDKLPLLPPVTVKAALVVWLSDPLVPVTVAV